MKTLLMRLKTTGGLDMMLRTGREMGWPDGTRMGWVRVVDGKPEIVTATLALVWDECAGNIRIDHDVSVANTPWDGFVQDRDATTDDDEARISEWADSFCAEVNAALADVAALKPFADLHWYELAAYRTWNALPRGFRGSAGALLRNAESITGTIGEEALAGYVRRTLEGAEHNSHRRAAAQYEAEGGRMETQESRPGSESGNLRGVPMEVLEQARQQARWCAVCAAPHTTEQCGRNGW